MSARYLSHLWILRHVYSTACFILSYFLTCMYFSNRSANNNVTTRSMNPRHFECVWAVQKMVFCTLLKTCHLMGKNHVLCLHIKRQDAAYYGICQDTENMASPSMDIYLIFCGNRELNCQPKWRMAAVQMQVLSLADCLHDMLFRGRHVECALAWECSCTHTARFCFSSVSVPSPGTKAQTLSPLCNLAVTNMQY